MGLLGRGMRERPLSRRERRRVAVLAAATAVGLVAVLVGVVLLASPGRDRLSPVLVSTGTLIVAAAGFISLRKLVPVRRHRVQAVMVAVLALLWLLSVVGYVRGR